MTMITIPNLKHFSQRDFIRCTPSCNITDMNLETLEKLDHAREMAGIPFILSSAYRTVKHEKTQGRPGTSSHTIGRAVDIICETTSQRYKMLFALLQAGFTRIGIAETFIHADDDPSKPLHITWLY